jgi:triosephosphate isomerase
MSDSRRPWLGTSWKMNKLRSEAVAYLAQLGEWACTADSAVGIAADIVICPPFTALDAAACELARQRTEAVTSDDGAARPTIRLGGQNMHWQPAGAQTGEISAAMLIDVGAEVVELGHFERRRQYGETDETVQRKVAAALGAGLAPIVCVGDDAQDRLFGVSIESVTRQVKIALHGVPERDLTAVVLAYEPGWAIGVGGEQADPAEVAPVHRAIRAAVEETHGPAADQVRIVYGGSVDESVAADYAAESSIDGLFVGRAALTPAGFITITERFARAREQAVLTPRLTSSTGRTHS